MDRVSGDGWVAAKDGDYADALAKGHTVILLVTESTGAFSADLDRVLRQLARTARASGSIDHTPYGTSRASTRSHYTFHSAAISPPPSSHRRRPHHSELGRRPRLRAHPRPSRSRPALDVGSAAIAVGATTSSRPPRSHCRAAANATDPTLLPRPRPRRPRQRSPRRARHHHRLYLRPQGLGGPP